MALSTLLKKIKQKDITEKNEAATCNALIEPILKELGWDLSDTTQVKPQHSVKSGRVDYTLVHPKSEMQVHIEVKSENTNLKGYERQLLRYGIADGTSIITITNGIVWWFYLPFYQERGKNLSFVEKRFAELNIKNDLHKDLIDEFKAYLSFNSLAESDKVEQNAMEALAERIKVNELENKIPEIWQNLLKIPPPELVELIVKRVEEEAGISPTNEQVSLFLSEQNATQVKLSQVAKRNSVATKKKEIKSTTKGSKALITIKILGKQLSVKNNREIWKSVVEELYSQQPEKFSSVVGKPHGNRSYVEIGNTGLRTPYQIRTTNYWIELAGDAGKMKQRSERLLQLLGFQEKDLVILDNSEVQRGQKIKKNTKKIQKSKQPVAITLFGIKHAVKSWRDVWVRVAGELHNKYPDEFMQVVGKPDGKRRSYVELSPNSMLRPRQIESSTYWIEVNAKPQDLQSRCYYLLEQFGYHRTELEFHF